VSSATVQSAVCRNSCRHSNLFRVPFDSQPGSAPVLTPAMRDNTVSSTQTGHISCRVAQAKQQGSMATFMDSVQCAWHTNKANFPLKALCAETRVPQCCDQTAGAVCTGETLVCSSPIAHVTYRSSVYYSHFQFSLVDCCIQEGVFSVTTHSRTHRCTFRNGFGRG
jgi:hypothetical protein